MRNLKLLLLLLFTVVYGCSPRTEYDVIIRNGQIYDGSGSPSYRGDIGINADTVAFV